MVQNLTQSKRGRLPGLKILTKKMHCKRFSFISVRVRTVLRFSSIKQHKNRQYKKLPCDKFVKKKKNIQQNISQHAKLSDYNIYPMIQLIFWVRLNYATTHHHPPPPAKICPPPPTTIHHQPKYVHHQTPPAKIYPPPPTTSQSISTTTYHFPKNGPPPPKSQNILIYNLIQTLL